MKTPLEYLYAYPWWSAFIGTAALIVLGACVVCWAASQTIHEEDREDKP